MPPVKKPRGRPRLSEGEHDDVTAKKRARLRDAQHAFRARKDATIGDLQQRVGLLEDVIDGMSTSMASVTDVLVREGVLGKNQAVDKHYADAMQYFVGLARTAATASDSDPDAEDAGAAAVAGTGPLPPPLLAVAAPLTHPKAAAPPSSSHHYQASLNPPLSPRLGSAVFPQLPHPLSTVPYTKDPDPILYTFTPLVRNMLLFLTAGRDSFLARMYMSITRRAFEGFASGDFDTGRMFFRFSSHEYDAAEVAERVFATMQLVLFGSYDSSMSPPFHLPQAPPINQHTIAVSRTLATNVTKTPLNADLQTATAAARRRLDYRSLLLNNLKSAVHKDMLATHEDLSGYVDAFSLADYLRLTYDIHVKTPDALRIVLPKEQQLQFPLDMENLVDFEGGIDTAFLSMFDPSPSESLTSSPSHSSVNSAAYLQQQPAREAVVSSELLFDGLYTAGICAGQGVMFDKRQLDGIVRSMIDGASFAAS